MRIRAITGNRATLENNLEADIGALDSCAVGDYVVVANGIAVSRIERRDAEAIRAHIKETYETLS